MDLNLIKRFQHFLAVVDEGHFGRAAARLGMSQPPLTAQIQALERGLGVRLLERSRQGTRPTAEGAVLLPAVRRLEEAARAVEVLAREVRSGKRAVLTIGCVTSGLFDPLPRLVRSFQAARPDVVVSVREMDTAVALEALRSGDVDVALARMERGRPPLQVLPGPADWLVAALPEGDALAKADQVDLAALAARPMVVLPRSISPAYFDGVLLACRSAGFEPNAVREVTSAMAQLALVSAGLGVALVSSGMARLAPPGVVFRRLRQGVAAVGVALAWNEERASEAVRALVGAGFGPAPDHASR
jgi:DNA-binding transcriptional LysR family regulator